MATQFQVPFNIPKGTATADAYRIAPKFDTLLSTTVNVRNQIFSGSSYNNYGPGMSMTPINTWNIVPYNTTVGNIVATNTPVGAGWLTLAADNFATTLVPTNNTGIFPPGAPNNFYLQFDWPRVPAVAVSADMTGPLNVTFFGTDWYGMPMQYTYVVQDAGTYGSSIYEDTIIFPLKAFYTITGVYINNATTNAATVTCTASNIFGLPYVLNSYNDVMNFKWNQQDMLTQGGSATLTGAGTVVVETPAAAAVIESRIPLDSQAPQLSLTNINLGGVAGTLYAAAVVPSSVATGTGTITINSSSAADSSTVSWFIENGGFYIIAPADTTSPATGLTGDVRGLFQLPLPGETWAVVPNPGTQTLATPSTPAVQVTPGIQAVFTWYVEGYDQWLNILSAESNTPNEPATAQPQGTIVGFPNLNGFVLPINSTDLVGQPQYYTGIPA